MLRRAIATFPGRRKNKNGWIRTETIKKTEWTQIHMTLRIYCAREGNGPWDHRAKQIAMHLRYWNLFGINGEHLKIVILKLNRRQDGSPALSKSYPHAILLGMTFHDHGVTILKKLSF